MKFEDIYERSEIKDDNFILEVKDILITSNNRMNIVLNKFKKRQDLINELNIRSSRGKTIQEQLFRLFYPEKSPKTDLYKFISFVRGYNCEYILGVFDYKEEIQKIINKTSQYHNIIRHNFTLWEEILDKTQDVITDVISEKIYYYMNDMKSNLCPNNNRYKYDGYSKKEKEIKSPIRFCNKTGKCQCAKEFVSKNISIKSASKTPEEKEKTNERRKQTVLEKSGGKYSNNIHSKNGQKELNERKQQRFEGLISYCIENSISLNNSKEEYLLARKNNSKLNFNCNTCNSNFSYKANAHINDIICRICNPADNKPVSNEEIDLRNFIVSLLDKDEHYTFSNQYIITPYELDIVLNDRKIAIEYNGMYWHSHKMNQEDEHYHSRKLTLCWNKGFRLFSVYSDDWENNRKVVENKIKSMLLSINLQNIVIKEIDKITENNFVKDFQFNLQNTDYCLGYYNDNELIATLSFCSESMIYFNSKYNNKEILQSLISFYNKDISISNIDLNYDDWKKYKDVGFSMIKRNLFEKYYITNNYHNKQKNLPIETKINDVLYDCGNILCEYKKVVDK